MWYKVYRLFKINVGVSMKVLIEYVKNMENVEDGNIYFHLAIPEHFEPSTKTYKE